MKGRDLINVINAILYFHDAGAFIFFGVVVVVVLEPSTELCDAVKPSREDNQLRRRSKRSKDSVIARAV